MSDTKTEVVEALGTLFPEAKSDEAKAQEENTAEEKVTENPAQEKETDSKESETDWKAEARKWEARAKEKGEATAELTKTNEKLENVRKELAEQKKATETAQAALTRYKIAQKYGISEELTELFLTGSDEETLEKQASALAERPAIKTPKPDRAQGNRNGSGSVSKVEQFSDMMSNLGFGA